VFVVVSKIIPQVWSNGLLKAPEHRVRPSMREGRTRFSAPFFYNPNYDAMVEPLSVQSHCREHHHQRHHHCQQQQDQAGEGEGEWEWVSTVEGELEKEQTFGGIGQSTVNTVNTVNSLVGDSTRAAKSSSRCGAIEGANYAPIRWGSYRNQRFQGDFKDVGEEIQIEHFTASPVSESVSE
jgi:hypothetical protein